MLKNKWSLGLAFLLLLAIFFARISEWNKKESHLQPFPITYDVFGYYLYLPATFIYDDPGYQRQGWLDSTTKIYSFSPTLYQLAGVQGSQKRVNIYNIGYSILFAPGFFIAHILASPLGFPADGFSPPYQFALEITAFLFFILGLLLFRKIALHYFSDPLSAALILFILGGSNYVFLQIHSSTMPHNFLFALNAIILWLVIRWHENKKTKHLYLLALTIALASICRPVEILWLIVPFFWQVSDLQSFRSKMLLFKMHLGKLIIAFILFTIIIFFQLFYFKYASGSFFDINHHSEGFSFLAPYTLEFLFSFRKGWLIYSPIMIVCLVGFFYLRKKSPEMFFPLFAFFIIYLYVVSSWDCWWYAASFGQRPMIEAYPLLMLPAGFFLVRLHHSKIFIRLVVYLLLCLFLFLNIFQTWQMSREILHLERMSKKYYESVFLKTQKPVDADRYLLVDRSNDAFLEYPNYQEKYIKHKTVVKDFEDFSEERRRIDSTAVSGKISVLLDTISPFSPAIELRANEISTKSYARIRAYVWVYLFAPISESNSCLVMNTQNGDRIMKYLTSAPQEEIPLKKWTRIQLDYITPFKLHPSDKTVIYYWNMGKSPLLIDNLQIEIFEPKEDYE